MLSLLHLRRFIPTAALGLLMLMLPLAVHSQTQPASKQPTPASKQPASASKQPSLAVFTALDEAANQRNLDQLLSLYSDDFRSGDGLNRKDLAQSLKSFWQRFADLRYSTEVIDSKTTAEGTTIEALTRITGQGSIDKRPVKLEAELRSRYQIQNNRIVRQDILAERTQLRTGQSPPTLDIQLPEQVLTGQSFNFDAIVREPLDNDLLVGGIMQEPVSISALLDPKKAELEPLKAGGVFKTSRAPQTPGNLWVTAMVIRKGGITAISQRLRVVN
jgi:hypothetical protein